MRERWGRRERRKPCARERIGRVAPAHEANWWAVFCYQPCPQTSGSSLSCQLSPQCVWLRNIKSLARLFLSAAGVSHTIESRSGSHEHQISLIHFPPAHEANCRARSPARRPHTSGSAAKMRHELAPRGQSAHMRRALGREARERERGREREGETERIPLFRLVHDINPIDPRAPASARSRESQSARQRPPCKGFIKSFFVVAASFG